LDRRLRLLLVGILISGIFGASFLLRPPEASVNVDEIATDPSKYQDDRLAVRGVVGNDTLDRNLSTFDLIGNQNHMSVDYAGIPISDGFAEGRTILVRGEVHQRFGNWVLVAEEITVGCPSKYEVE